MKFSDKLFKIQAKISVSALILMGSMCHLSAMDLDDFNLSGGFEVSGERLSAQKYVGSSESHYSKPSKGVSKYKTMFSPGSDYSVSPLPRGSKKDSSRLSLDSAGSLSPMEEVKITNHRREQKKGEVLLQGKFIPLQIKKCLQQQKSDGTHTATGQLDELIKVLSPEKVSKGQAIHNEQSMLEERRELERLRLENKRLSELREQEIELREQEKKSRKEASAALHKRLLEKKALSEAKKEVDANAIARPAGTNGQEQANYSSPQQHGSGSKSKKKLLETKLKSPEQQEMYAMESAEREVSPEKRLTLSKSQNKSTSELVNDLLSTDTSVSASNRDLDRYISAHGALSVFKATTNDSTVILDFGGDIGRKSMTLGELREKVDTSSATDTVYDVSDYVKYQLGGEHRQAVIAEYDEQPEEQLLETLKQQVLTSVGNLPVLIGNLALKAEMLRVSQEQLFQAYFLQNDYIKELEADNRRMRQLATGV
ncbi:MAG: hypothetical protein NWS47_03540, partial [Alphaproteobacteria bacterium]|nr:hypothetical protein [Alphaproteobacteria bacterium]